MAYNLGDRFPKIPKYYALLDPGQYKTISDRKQKENVAPFLSKSPRVCRKGNKIWTHATYNPKTNLGIPNCTSIVSKVPRFKYEAIINEDFDKIICQCNTQNACECLQKKEPDVNTEEPERRRIFIGPYPRSMSDAGISVPCGRDRGFKCYSDGTQKRILDGFKNGPPYYNTEVREFTAFYRGCKWSHWTSRRSPKTVEDSPGPASYTIEHEPTESERCAEKFRADRRKKSKQYRFIEMVQQKNLRENLPGPSTYKPNTPKGTDLQFLGPKTERFRMSKYDVIPSPNTYTIRRAFDLSEPLNNYCHTVLPKKAAFGVKAPRLNPIKHEGPGPADYETNRKLCHITFCPKAPFGSSSRRFPETKELDENADDEEEENEFTFIYGQREKCLYSNLNWMFKSHTKRITPLKKKLFEPSPADLHMQVLNAKRSLQLQKTSPFHASAERFQPWYNWIPIQSLEQTPGPGQYRLDKPLCTSTVVWGPLYRSKRFKASISISPPCNIYNVQGGVETVLNTSNERLKENIRKKREFCWKASRQKCKLSDKEKESLLLNNCIALLNADLFSDKICNMGKNYSKSSEKRTKLLHCFMYRHPIPNYF